MRTGRFREDLYYRLATIALHVPPLRERPMDLPLLARRLLESSSKALDKPVEGFTQEALACIAAYRWPGNVRELQNEILRMVALATTPRLGADLLSTRVLRTPIGEFDEARPSDDLVWAAGLTGGLKERMDQLEKHVLKEAMIRLRWNKSRVARELGLSRVGLRAKLVRYGLEQAE
ncbi:Hydrogenase transcriptional regulatory protein hupR1 [bioreactor metagenome]|uniref:Hydrogenase transcriptional regulatory protein hupR1 n=1 Tax=bioreactor metagenome TaxID=1076179 RepID=A0A645I3G1_9ZZZZ